MTFQKTWEKIVEPEKPIPLHELELIVTEGDPFTLGQKRPALYEEVLRYWDRKQVEMTTVRARDLANALMQQDTAKVERMQRQIGGVDKKHSLSRATLQGKKLYLAMNTVNYMYLAGTNFRAITDPVFRETLMLAGMEDYADCNRHFANAFGLCAVVYGYESSLRDASDGYALIAKRSDKVAIYPNVHHVIGGFPDVDADRTKVDFGSHLFMELKEEIGLDSTEFGEPQFYGIVRQIPSRHPEVVCGIPVYLPQEELQQRWRDHAPGKFEHRGLDFYSFSALPEFLEQHGTAMVPAGQAALMYVLQHHGIPISTEVSPLAMVG